MHLEERGKILQIVDLHDLEVLEQAVGLLLEQEEHLLKSVDLRPSGDHAHVVLIQERPEALDLRREGAVNEDVKAEIREALADDKRVGGHGWLWVVERGVWSGLEPVSL